MTAAFSAIGALSLAGLFGHGLFRTIGQRTEFKSALGSCAIYLTMGLLAEGVLVILMRLGGIPPLALYICNLLVILPILRRSPTRRPPSATCRTKVFHSWLHFTLAFAVLSGTLLIGLFWMNYPFGNMDAYSCWLLKARFIAEGGDTSWSKFFSRNFGNAEYPFLYSATIAYCWILAGPVNLTAACLVQIAFVLGTCATVYEGVRRYSNSSQAAFAGILLMSNVYLLYRASCLYADVPLMFLCTLLAVQLAHACSASDTRSFIFLGIIGGIAVNIKQEGAVYFANTILLLIISHYRTPAGLFGIQKKLRMLVLASLPLLILHVTTQSLFRETSPALTPRVNGATELLLDWSRYQLIGASLLKILGNWRWWGFLLLFTVCLVPAALRNRNLPVRIICLFALMQIATMTAYFLLTPVSLEYHLRTAHERLMLHVWPALIIATVSAVRSNSFANEE